MTWRKPPKPKPQLTKIRKGKTLSHIGDPQNFWENVLWTGERKFNFFLNATSDIKLTGFSKMNTTHALKHGGGGMMGSGRHAGLRGRIII